MNTEKVYFGRIFQVSSIDNEYLRTCVNLEYEKKALIVSRRNIFGMKYMEDLNTGERYNVKLPTRIGDLYVSRTLESFNEITNNKKNNLPKEKIKMLGNKHLYKTKEK